MNLYYIFLLKIFEGTLFEGSLVVWLIGLPIIIAIALFFEDKGQTYLFLPANKYKNPAQLISQINFLQRIIHNEGNAL
jgi:hypothetical protein